tara:strand:- start:1706 stop:2128 length:423 start_codon:yes stop_codon:yes gene_type:complete
MKNMLSFIKWLVARISGSLFGWAVRLHLDKVDNFFNGLLSPAQIKRLTDEAARLGEYHRTPYQVKHLCEYAKRTKWHMFWLTIIWAVVTMVSGHFLFIKDPILYAIAALPFCYYLICNIHAYYKLFWFEREETWSKLKHE